MVKMLTFVKVAHDHLSSLTRKLQSSFFANTLCGACLSCIASAYHRHSSLSLLEVLPLTGYDGHFSSQQPLRVVAGYVRADLLDTV
jgi:hypothetical protein